MNVNETFPTNQMFGVNPVGSSMPKDRMLLERALRHKHMVEFVERFKWQNLPESLTQDLIERIIYFRSKGMFFKYLEKYYFLPFTLQGTIDSYGRYESIVPVLFTGQWATKNSKEEGFLPDAESNRPFRVFYSLNQEIEDRMAVILNDSTLEISQDLITQNELVNPFIEQLADILVLVNIDLISSAKTFTIIAKDEDQKAAIEKEMMDTQQRTLYGKPWTVIVGDAAMQITELKGNPAKDSARYFQSYQSFDNLRKEILGIQNSGTFLKQEHMTTQETDLNSGSSNYVLNNALRQRKEFCDLVNTLFGLNISVDINQQEESSVVAPEGEQTKQLKGDSDNANI